MQRRFAIMRKISPVSYTHLDVKVYKRNHRRRRTEKNSTNVLRISNKRKGDNTMRTAEEIAEMMKRAMEIAHLADSVLTGENRRAGE